MAIATGKWKAREREEIEKRGGVTEVDNSRTKSKQQEPGGGKQGRKTENVAAVIPNAKS